MNVCHIMLVKGDVDKLKHFSRVKHRVRDEVFVLDEKHTRIGLQVELFINSCPQHPFKGRRVCSGDVVLATLLDRCQILVVKPFYHQPVPSKSSDANFLIRLSCAENFRSDELTMSG